MHYSKALAALLIVAAPAAFAEPLTITFNAVGTTGLVQMEDFGVVPAGSLFQAQWTANFDSTDVVGYTSPYPGERVTIASGTSAINIAGTLITPVADPGQLDLGVHNGTEQQPDEASLTLNSPVFFNDHYYRFEFTLFPEQLPGSVLAQPGTYAWTDAHQITGRLIGAFGDGSANGYIELLPSALTVAISAVPEPGTYALLLTGLCTVGFAAYRRRTAPV